MRRPSFLRGATGTAFVRYLARRGALSVVVILGVVVIVFFLSHVVPANPAGLWAGPRAREADLLRARAELHLDDPLPVQFYHYLADLFAGNFGVSLRTHSPVLADLGQSLPATFELITAALGLAIVVGIPLGVVAGIRRGTWVDHGSRIAAIGGVSVPSFWLAVVLQLVFVSWLGLLPISGYVSDYLLIAYPVRRITGSVLLDALLQGNFAVFFDGLRHMVLPAVTLAAYPIGLVARMVRTMMIEALGENYVRTARAYGLPRNLIHYRYALKNAISPAIVALGLSFAYSLIGAFLIENIFSWPGVGRYAYLSVVTFDYPAILAISVVVSIFYVVVNLGVDLIQAVLDPRIVLAKGAT